MQITAAELDVLLPRIPHNLDVAETMRLYYERQDLAFTMWAALGSPDDDEEEDTRPVRRHAGPVAGDLVSLEQIALMVYRSPRSLLRYVTNGMPPAAERGRRGRPSLWKRASIRPWLVAAFGIPLPERFPGGQGVAEGQP